MSNNSGFGRLSNGKLQAYCAITSVVRRPCGFYTSARSAAFGRWFGEYDEIIRAHGVYCCMSTRDRVRRDIILSENARCLMVSASHLNAATRANKNGHAERRDGDRWANICEPTESAAIFTSRGVISGLNCKRPTGLRRHTFDACKQIVRCFPHNARHNHFTHNRVVSYLLTYIYIYI